jgi:hypothetical protein
MPEDPHLKQILRRLALLRIKLRARLLEEGAAWSLLVCVSCVLATLGLDYAFRLERPLRATTTILAALALLWTLWRRLVLPAFVPMRATDLAQLLERRQPYLGDRLLSAIDFARSAPSGAESAGMARRVLVEAADLSTSLDLSRIVERRRGARLLVSGLCAVALLVGLGVWQRDVMSLWARRNLLLADADWPQRTYLQVEGEDFTLLRGDDLRVIVRAEGSRRVPSYITVHARYPRIGWTQETVELSAGDDGEYAKVFSSVAEEFEFYVTGGDDHRDRRRPHRVRLIDPPSLVGARFLVEYPAYMGRRPHVIDGSRGVLSVPPTSWVQVEAQATKDLRTVTLLLDGEPIGTASVIDAATDAAPASAASPRHILGRFQAPLATDAPASPLTHELRIALEDSQGYRDRGEQTFLVEVERDASPSASLRKRFVGSAVSPQAIVPLRIRAEDDCGVATATVNVSAAARALDRQEEPVELASRADARKLDIDHEVDLRDYGAAPGDSLDVSVALQDNLPLDLGGPNAGRAGPLTFRVIPPEELSADLVRRQKALRLEFVEAIALQENAVPEVRRQSGDDAELTPEARRKLGEAAREQAAVGAECAKAADSFDAIRLEMTYNRLGSDQERRDLDDDVIQPLRDLPAPITAIAAALNQAASHTGSGAAGQLSRAVEAQEQVLAQMNAILARMQKLESRQDMINVLRMILGWSQKQLEAIEAKSTEEAGEIFEP